jgi:hypothetical protein
MCGGLALTNRISGKVSPNRKECRQIGTVAKSESVANSESVAKSEKCRQIGNISDTNF